MSLALKGRKEKQLPYITTALALPVCLPAPRHRNKRMEAGVAMPVSSSACDSGSPLLSKVLWETPQKNW